MPVVSTRICREDCGTSRWKIVSSPINSSRRSAEESFPWARRPGSSTRRRSSSRAAQLHEYDVPSVALYGLYGAPDKIVRDRSFCREREEQPGDLSRGRAVEHLEPDVLAQRGEGPGPEVEHRGCQIDRQVVVKQRVSRERL